MWKVDAATLRSGGKEVAPVESAVGRRRRCSSSARPTSAGHPCPRSPRRASCDKWESGAGRSPIDQQHPDDPTLTPASPSELRRPAWPERCETISTVLGGPSFVCTTEGRTCAWRRAPFLTDSRSRGCLGKTSRSSVSGSSNSMVWYTAVIFRPVHPEAQSDCRTRTGSCCSPLPLKKRTTPSFAFTT